MGDGLLFLSLGTVLPFKELLTAFLLGLFFCCFWGIVVLFLSGKGKKTEMPFVPFLKKRIKRGSMTIEAALLMPLLLLVVTITLYLFFYVHNKVWLTAAAYEAALDGSMETARPEGKSRDKALKKGKELGNTGFYESKNLKLQVSEGKKVQVTYDLDMFSIYGGFNSHLQVQESVKVIKPVTWIRKVKGLSEVSNKLKG